MYFGKHGSLWFNLAHLEEACFAFERILLLSTERGTLIQEQPSIEAGQERSTSRPRSFYAWPAAMSAAGGPGAGGSDSKIPSNNRHETRSEVCMIKWRAWLPSTLPTTLPISRLPRRQSRPQHPCHTRSARLLHHPSGHPCMAKPPLHAPASVAQLG